MKCNTCGVVWQYKGKRRHNLKEGEFKCIYCDLDEELSANKSAAISCALEDKHLVDIGSEARSSNKPQPSSNDISVWTTQMVGTSNTSIPSMPVAPTKSSGGGLLSKIIAKFSTSKTQQNPSKKSSIKKRDEGQMKDDATVSTAHNVSSLSFSSFSNPSEAASLNATTELFSKMKLKASSSKESSTTSTKTDGTSSKTKVNSCQNSTSSSTSVTSVVPSKMDLPLANMTSGSSKFNSKRRRSSEAKLRMGPSNFPLRAKKENSRLAAEFSQARLIGSMSAKVTWSMPNINNIDLPFITAIGPLSGTVYKFPRIRPRRFFATQEQVTVIGDSCFSSAVSVFQSICPQYKFTYDDAHMGCLSSLVRGRKSIKHQSTVIIQLGQFDLQRYDATKSDWIERFKSVLKYLLEQEVRLYVSFIMAQTERTAILRGSARFFNKKVERACQELNICYLDAWYLFWQLEECFDQSGTHLSHYGNIVLVKKWSHLLSSSITSLRSAGSYSVLQTTDSVTYEPLVREPDAKNQSYVTQDLELDEQLSETSSLSHYYQLDT